MCCGFRPVELVGNGSRLLEKMRGPGVRRFRLLNCRILSGKPPVDQELEQAARPLFGDAPGSGNTYKSNLVLKIKKFQTVTCSVP